MDSETAERLEQLYLRFAQFEAKGYSPLYEAFATAVARDKAVLERLAELPRKKQQPNLLLAAVRLKHGVAPDAHHFCRLVLADWDGIKATMLARSTQTNEPARCATLLPVLASLAQPIAILEVGAAAGLCLFPDRYAYDYGKGRVLQPDRQADPPTFRCRANDETPIPRAVPRISWRAGIDIHPLSAPSEEDMNWLRQLVWPEQLDRLARLDRAIRIAASDPPRIVEGDLLTCFDQVVEDMPDDATRVVFHSAVLAYLTRSDREEFVELLAGRGLVWISNEHPSVLRQTPDTDVPPDKWLLSVDGDPVAVTGPHGQSIDWL